MGLLKVITYGHPVLRQKAEIVRDIDENIIKIIKDMELTLEAEKGIGLAAPQVGISKRIFIVDLTPTEEKIKNKIVLLNPVIVERSEEVNSYEEGCLSIPGVWGNVERPATIKIKGELINGNTVIFTASGLYARALQHELDHLDGKLFIDYLSYADKKKNESLIEKLIEDNKKVFGSEVAL